MKTAIWRAAAAVAIATAPMGAQQPTARSLGPVQAEFTEPLNQISEIRELRDGRVIVLDVRDRAIHAIDLVAKKDMRIGRLGSGPGEYLMPRRLFSLPGDSSAVFDMANSSLALVITPQGKAGGTLPNASKGFSAAPLSDLSFLDGSGRIYLRTIRNNVPMNESIAIARIDRATGESDTVAVFDGGSYSPLVKRPSGDAKLSGGGRASRSSQGPIPFMVIDWDRWAVARDGRVAIVSVDPYQVRYVDQNKHSTIGPVIATERLAVTEADKDAWREDNQRPVATLRWDKNGQKSAGFEKRNYVEPDAWPDYLPTFVGHSLWFAPNGLLWVKRAVTAGTPDRFDLIDEAGRLVSRLTLPKNTHLVGFGARSVYLARLDDSDLEYLQRYALPPR